MIILIFGLPGSGKTALAKSLLNRVDAIHLNADEVRADLNSDLGFSVEDRVEQARRMGALARLLSSQGKLVVVDFVCPTKETRLAFGKADFTVWMNRISEGRFEDTNKLWETPDPEYYQVEVEANWGIEKETSTIIEKANLFDWSAPTTLMLGRYQPWHEGHEALKNEGHERTPQVLVGVRNTYKTSEKDPLTFEEVERYIRQNSGNLWGSTLVLRLPNITNIIYGRDVGYKIEHVELSAEIQAISATQKRKELGI